MSGSGATGFAVLLGDAAAGALVTVLLGWFNKPLSPWTMFAAGLAFVAVAALVFPAAGWPLFNKPLIPCTMLAAGLALVAVAAEPPAPGCPVSALPTP